MTQLSYKRAPITEAVIAINFETPIDSELLASVSNKFSAHYPNHQNVANLDLKVQIPTGEEQSLTTQVGRDLGHRRSSSDVTELMVLWRSALVVSQLAPYPGWDTFFQRFVRDWKIWKRVVDFRTVSRIGVRYINRLDIPLPKTGNIIEHEAYLNVYPQLPTIFGPVGSYAVQAALPVEGIDCKLVLNSAVVPSPILGHISIVVDQDIIRDANVPQSDDAIYALLNEIRIKKNGVFEACISDRARELFGNE